MGYCRVGLCLVGDSLLKLLMSEEKMGAQRSHRRARRGVHVNFEVDITF